MAEELRYTVWRHHVGGCTHPMVSIVPHGSRWIWISLPGLMILPCEVPIVPHCHICPRVTLLTVLLFMWGFHFLSVNFPTEPELLALEFLIHRNGFLQQKQGNPKTVLQLFFFKKKTK